MSVIKRLRYWQRTTPNSELAWTLVGIGCVLILVAGLIIGFRTHWL